MDCLDLKGKVLRSQLAALGYFQLEEDTLGVFHNSEFLNYHLLTAYCAFFFKFKYGHRRLSEWLLFVFLMKLDKQKMHNVF